MAGVHAAFVGCKVSQADAAAALAALCDAGHRPAPAAAADLALVVTCCVTAEAERKSRQLARRLASGGRPVIVTGCAATYRPAQFAVPGVVVAARDELAAVAGRLAKRPGVNEAAETARAAADRPDARSGRPRVGHSRPRTRLTLKVQDGCSGACSYCAVRLARGPLWSLPLHDAASAARAGIAGGCGEIVLSGVNIGLYRDAGGAGLAGLVASLVALPGLRRLRLSSIEPQHLRAPLLAALAQPLVARHLHVPLQSADDGVLAAMRRPYTFGEYLATLDAARAAMGEIMVSTDVIVGFPSEDEAAFERTLDALRGGRFGRVHVFPYSRRPGTAAASVPPLPPGIVKARRAAALAAAEAAHAAAARAEIGTAAEVLVEDRVDGHWCGYTSRYTRCYIGDGAVEPGTLVTVAVEGLFRNGVRGALV